MPSGNIKTNRLNIYLIKQEFQRVEDIVDSTELPRDIPGVGQFVYDQSHPHPPPWLQDFFGSTLDGGLNILASSAKGVLVVPCESAGTTLYFALTFGTGRHLLKPGVFEEHFGLKIVLNSVSPESFRSISKTTLGSVLKQSREQMSREVTPAEFGIDIEQDLLSSVTGKSRYSALGNMITGKDSLSLSTKVAVTNIKDFLGVCLERYRSREYEVNFPWIDQVSEVRNVQKVESLNNALIGNINAGQDEKIWLAVPEVIDWSDLQGFRYGKPKRGDLHDDLNLGDFLATLQGTPVTTDILKGQRVFMISSARDDVSESWPALQCLYAETRLGNDLYVLNNGKWYAIAQDFAAQVVADFASIAPSLLALPDCTVNDEESYTRLAVGSIPSACCMDRQFVMHGGGQNKIEFCDIYTTDGKIVHVKRYGASAVLSHLFSQGLVAGELFLADREFREKLNEKLPVGHKLSNTSDRPNPAQFEVVYAIISESTHPLDIPFFSKVNLRNARRRLAGYGFPVTIKKIQKVAS